MLAQSGRDATLQGMFRALRHHELLLTLAAYGLCLLTVSIELGALFRGFMP
jgi:hypothetical protein